MLDSLLSSLTPDTLVAQATGFKGLLKGTLLIGNVSIYESYDNLGAFVNAAYKTIISLAAVVAVGQFVYGGIVYMLAESGVPQMGEAKDRMTNALLGLIMLLSTYVVFNQINPELLNLNFDLRQVEETQQIKQPSRAPCADRSTGCPQ